MQKLISWTRVVLDYPFIRFLLIGGSGAFLNLFIVWALTTFVFGLEHYFIGYLVSVAFNFIYTFILYTRSVFKTTSNHGRRLTIFVLYSIVITFIQANVVHFLTPLVGLRYYLLVIAVVALVFAVLNYGIFRSFLFRESSSAPA